MTDLEWVTMTWPERLKRLMQENSLSTTAELSVYLGTRKSSLTKIMSGERGPGKALAARIKDMCLYEEKTDRNSAISAFSSFSTDNTLTMLAPYIASCSTSAKMAFMSMMCCKIVHVIKELYDIPVTTTVTTSFATQPVSAAIKLMYPEDQSFYGLIVVEYAESDETKIVLRMQLMSGGKRDSAVAYLLNDRAVVSLICTLKSYFEAKYKLKLKNPL